MALKASFFLQIYDVRSFKCNIPAMNVYLGTIYLNIDHKVCSLEVPFKGLSASLNVNSNQFNLKPVFFGILIL